MAKHIYNLVIEHKKQIPQHLYKHIKPSVPLPVKVDLRRHWNFVYDQGQLGSCTSQAICSLLHFDNASLLPSRLLHYYNERALDGDISIDAGSTLSQGINALVYYGICQEKDWPYSIEKFAVHPPDGVYQKARAHKIYSYRHVRQTLQDMKAALASNIPFVFGILVYESFESDSVAMTGVVPLPNPTIETLLGGHALCAVGYDDKKQAFIVRNSWGSGWGDRGYCYIPYSYLVDRGLTSDLWVIEKCT